jgi:hypothetical protein
MRVGPLAEVIKTVAQVTAQPVSKNPPAASRRSASSIQHSSEARELLARSSRSPKIARSRMPGHGLATRCRTSEAREIPWRASERSQMLACVGSWAALLSASVKGNFRGGTAMRLPVCRVATSHSIG